MYTHRLTVLLLLICLSLGHAQWAQTFGWGGAGNGKRSAWSTGSNSEKYDCSQNNENILNAISSLVQVGFLFFSFFIENADVLLKE